MSPSSLVDSCRLMLRVFTEKILASNLDKDTYYSHSDCWRIFSASLGTFPYYPVQPLKRLQNSIVV